MFASHDQRRIAQQVERAAAEQRPDEVDDTLFKLAVAIVQLRERVDALEAASGIAKG
jgi:hypothetical protein